jgi:hypothetical protein
MEAEDRSPRVTHLSWGRIEIDGSSTAYKDVKLFPGGARGWDWSETGTEHSGGIQPADVEELLEHGATVVVLAIGIYERLGVPRATLELLADRGVTAHVLQTEKAVELYNELAESERVGGLFHTTC